MSITKRNDLVKPRNIAQVLLRSSYTWLPLLILVVFAAPSIPYMLPSPTSYLGEDYQPFQALEFLGSKGQAFHKYGPLGNFLLAPGYLLSLAFWYLQGTFTKPVSTFPYGFQQPLEQISFLIWQGRVIFLAVSVGLLAYFITNLRLISQHKTVIFFAFLLCISTNYPAVSLLPSTRPDGIMMAFCAAALAVYLQIIYLGLTPVRGFWLSVLAACAVSGKEIAGPMFVLPYLAIGIVNWQTSRHTPEQRKHFWKSVTVTLGAGIVSYALLNIVYAPATWWQRISFWLFDYGIDSAAWGGLDSGAITPLQYYFTICQSLLNNLGPGGAIVTLLSVTVLVIFRPKNWLLLSVPFISIMALGLLPMGYARDRFYIVPTLCLVPMVTASLSILWDRAVTRSRLRWLTVALVIPSLINLFWGTFIWHALTINSDLIIEQHAKANLASGTSLYILFPYSTISGRSRLDGLGYVRDTRSLQEIMTAPVTTRADWLYATKMVVDFLNDSQRFPARAEMLERVAQLNIQNWRGIEGLGYSKIEVLDPKTPSWFVFNWMPVVEGLRYRNTVLVFRKTGAEIAP